MCKNLDLRFLLFYCPFMLVFFFLFAFFVFQFFIALPLFFTFAFVSIFRPLWVSSVAYPNLLGIKGLVVVLYFVEI
jgi:hypothetical protein